MSSRPTSPRLLIVDDEHGIRKLCGDVLRRSGYLVEALGDGEAALRRLSAAQAEGAPFDLVISDVRMKPMDGLAFISAVRALDDDVRVMLITGYPTLETAVEGMKQGARNYLTKPFTPIELRDAVKEALAGWTAPLSGSALEAAAEDEVERFGGLVARSASMKALFAQLRRIARAQATVLITGESGTGKELVARAVWQHSPRRDRLFAPVNCSALVDSLMESELFGHLKGAFTGANQQKAGLFQYADGGTLFLDEIGDLSLALQPKLLRVLQEGEIKPVGGVRGVKVDVRVIAATHRDLEAHVQAGAFREDLFYRLNVFRVEVPPLRARRDDIEPLADAFLHDLRERIGRPGVHLTPRALAALQGYAWPGNVRQLRNVLLRAATLAPEDAITPEDLWLDGAEGAPPPTGDYPFEDLTLEDVERRHILHVLRRCQGNRSHAARILGINRTTLWKKLSRYGLEDA